MSVYIYIYILYIYIYIYVHENNVHSRLCYHYNSFVATHALGHMMYGCFIYI